VGAAGQSRIPGFVHGRSLRSLTAGGDGKSIAGAVEYFRVTLYKTRL
jgi:hypothetical protein